jgi:hypothetical protein
MLSIKYFASRHFLAVLFMTFILAGLLGASMADDETIKQLKTPYANEEITIKIIPSSNSTFGYNILLLGRPFIHQPNIPGLQGNDGFTTKERAEIVARFVVKKIRNNEMPPVVTIEELNNLDVLK